MVNVIPLDSYYSREFVVLYQDGKAVGNVMPYKDVEFPDGEFTVDSYAYLIGEKSEVALQAGSKYRLAKPKPKRKPKQKVEENETA